VGLRSHMRQWGNEDLDFALNAWMLGYRVLHDPGATIAHRFQGIFQDYEVAPESTGFAQPASTSRTPFGKTGWSTPRTSSADGSKNSHKASGPAAWEIFQRDRASAEHKRTYLLSHRQRDEFWFARKFQRSWPTMGGAGTLAGSPLPPRLFYVDAMATPFQHQCELCALHLPLQILDEIGPM
jgi:hypothetical protein